jgi:diketogulonate reductase-like aldo/keto reductase
MALSEAESIKLSNGVEFPLIGLGTWRMTPEQAFASVPVALDQGYKLIDTATEYRNEEAIGKALKERSHHHVFITTKLQTRDQGYENAKAAIDASIKALGHVDLYLIHWPGAAGVKPDDPKNAELRKASWKAIEEAYHAKKFKAIGVANYEIKHLEEMKSYSKVMPMVNQIEIQPMYFPKDLIKYCRDNDIVVQAYSSLGGIKLVTDEYLKKFPIIKELAEKYKKSVPQILLRWALQHSLPILPKSTHKERIKENFNITDFKISQSDMDQLDAIHKKHWEKTCWDPKDIY